MACARWGSGDILFRVDIGLIGGVLKNFPWFAIPAPLGYQCMQGADVRDFKISGVDLYIEHTDAEN